MYSDGYPTNNFQWFDNSGASSDTLFSAPTDGLNVPFAFIQAERGTPGAIYFGGAKELYPILGQSTFDPSQPYFNAATQFIGTAMAGQGVEVMRLVDPAATTATMALFATVNQTLVTQYKLNADGSRKVDKNGNWIPKTKSDGTTIVQEAGIIVSWSVRQLASTEDFDTLQPVVTHKGSSSTITVYPVLGFQMNWPGAAGNRQGFTLYSEGVATNTINQAIGSVLYRFIPMELALATSSTPSPIADVLGSSFNSFSFKDSAVYTATNTNYSLSYLMRSAYVDGNTGQSLLPYTTHVYSANVGTIGALALTLSPELGTLDPFLIDLVNGTDLNGNLYNHIQIDSSTASVANSVVVNYASGGSDGDTSWAMFESQVANWLAGDDYGEFRNLQQHPMTHFADPGFSMSTKTLLFNMLDLRDNFKIDVSTQDISLPANTKAQDISAGQLLMFRAQMHPESVVNGVGCCRVGVYAHAARLISSSPYQDIVPFNLNRLIQRRNLDGGTYIRGSSGGLPNSQVTIFQDPNWVADDVPSQALAWANCINVVRHANRTTIFYPSLRTVYPNDTSLLSDDEISDRIIYMFKICRAIWAKYAGVRRPAKKLYPLIQADINNGCKKAFSGDDIRVKSTVFQTAEDANLGYAISVNLAVTGALPVRVINFNVVLDRQGN